MRITLLFIYFSLLPLILLSQEEKEWKLVKQQKGINIYSMPVSESPMNAVKATVVVDCPIGAVYAAIVDAKNHPSWVYQCKNAKILEQINDSSWYLYARTKTPWPIDDRDFAAYICVHKYDDNRIIVTGKGISDYVPKRKDIVRLPYSFSEWKLTPLPAGKTYVELLISVDVGGTIPPWILNLFISRGPCQTCYNLFREVHNKKYRNAKLPAFLTE